MAKLKCIALFLYAAIFSAAVMADDNINVRDGRPCLNGICIGDEISTLAGIKWQTASFLGKPIISSKMRKEDLKNQLDKFAPSSAVAVTAAASYLHYKLFDNQAIPKLAKLTGFCARGFHVVEGNFISASGHPTTVYINVFPGDDPSSQSLRVIYIERKFPTEYTNAQISELTKGFGERYRGVKKGRSTTAPAWDFNYERKLRLYASTGNLDDKAHIFDQLKKYPGCGKSLKID